MTYESRNITQVLVGLRPRQLAELDRIKTTFRVTRSVLVREAIDLWLNYKEKPGGRVKRDKAPN